MALLMSGWVWRMTLAVRGDTGGKSCLCSARAVDRQNDGGSSLWVTMVTCGRWAAVASAKVGSCSSMVMRVGSSSELEAMEEWREEVDNLLDTWSDIY